jgi:hypothetical protein
MAVRITRPWNPEVESLTLFAFRCPLSAFLEQKIWFGLAHRH